ncbi:MAG: YjfI family protein [Zoogloeaceae bacterium]|nr:YjfI family protein [Zoogloeaceae bacterium]
MQTLQKRLEGLDVLIGARLSGAPVSLQPIPGTIPVAQVVIGGREELPIFITASDAQILCICYLWHDTEIVPEKRLELLETMLDLNPAIPLSSFGRVEGRHVLFGALSRDARAEDIADDVATLSDNALDALEALSPYLL